jgi:hypothetical protein
VPQCNRGILVYHRLYRAQVNLQTQPCLVNHAALPGIVWVARKCLQF